MFSLGLVECPRELVAAIHCGLIQINRQPFTGRDVQRRTLRLCEEMSDGRCWSGLDSGHHHRRDCRLAREQFMKSSMGLIMNIVLGIVGAAIASAILSYFGIVLGGWFGYLISGFIGAVLLIWIVRMYGQLEDIRPRRASSLNRQKPFTDALRLEICAGNDPRHLRAIARKLIEMAEGAICNRQGR